MQISASNLLVAAGQQPKPPPAQAKAAAFEPSAFAEKPSAPASIAPAKPYGQAAMPGSTLDISV